MEKYVRKLFLLEREREAKFNRAEPSDIGLVNKSAQSYLFSLIHFVPKHNLSNLNINEILVLLFLVRKKKKLPVGKSIS